VLVSFFIFHIDLPTNRPTQEKFVLNSKNK
jgi:hypothetical protein